MFRLAMQLLVLFAASVALPPAASAAPGRTILVLDASGSMWGQIAGEAKVTIAQRVISGLLETLPADQELGLSVYGHRRKGDCGDIELIVPPGPDTRDAIRAAVEAIRPRGKTPLSAAVLAAAEALKYTEEAATVILVSDGRETCDLDPCAIGRQLEETGVDFTAHVVGFDVTEAEDRAQLQCLAENTGGRFLTASNAEELGAALAEVASAPPPAPEPEPVATIDMLFRAVDGEGGPEVRSGLVWTLVETGTGTPVLEGFELADLRIALAPGRYGVTVRRKDDEAEAAREVAVTPDGPREVTLVLPTSTPPATVSGPQTAPAGATVPVTWTGPAEKNDFIVVAEPDAPGSRHITYAYTRDGSPVALRLPPDPGEYELRYILADGRKVLARQPIRLEPVSATLEAPAEATIGSTLMVGWTGPDYHNDYVSVTSPGDPGSRQINFTYTREGTPLGLRMPAEPGVYEIRYIMQQGRRILASREVTVRKAEVSLTAPSTAVAGSDVVVLWKGPDERSDYIAVSRPDDPGARQESYSYTREGSPLTVQMPAEPGAYEIRYVMNQDRQILARRTIEVTAVTATLDAPSTAKVAQPVVVQWTGPDYRSDYIAVARTGDPGSRQETYSYTREGSPLRVEMPAEPGSYEIRYIMNQDRRILASVPVEVADVEAFFDIPGTAPAASTMRVDWVGPDYRGDYIALAEADSPDREYLSYVYTREGSPVSFELPQTPGAYEIRYVMDAGRRVIGRAVLTVE